MSTYVSEKYECSLLSLLLAHLSIGSFEYFLSLHSFLCQLAPSLTSCLGSRAGSHVGHHDVARGAITHLVLTVHPIVARSLALNLIEGLEQLFAQIRCALASPCCQLTCVCLIAAQVVRGSCAFEDFLEPGDANSKAVVHVVRVGDLGQVDEP